MQALLRELRLLDREAKLEAGPARVKTEEEDARHRLLVWLTV